MYFGHKHVETGRNRLHELATFLKYHMPLMGKNTDEEKSGLISVMGTLHQGNQHSSAGMLNLNAVVQTPMTLNVLVAQNQQLFRKT